MNYLIMILIYIILSFQSFEVLSSEVLGVPGVQSKSEPVRDTGEIPLIVRLSNSQVPKEDIIIYDPSGSSQQRLTLKETHPNSRVFEGQCTLPFGSGGFKSFSLRDVSFMKNRGWHYRFSAKLGENDLAQTLILDLKSKKVPPVKKTILSEAELTSISHSIAQAFASNPSLSKRAPAAVQRNIKTAAETVITGDTPVILRLVDSNQKTEPEIIVYDEFSKTYAYFHLKEKGVGVHEGLYRFRIGSPDVYLPRFRVDSFMKNKGWHYPYVSYYENDQLVIELNPKMAPPEKISEKNSGAINASVQQAVEKSELDKKIGLRDKIAHLLKEKKYNEAESLSQIGIAMDPFDPSLRYLHGTALYGLKKYEGAIQEFSVAAQDPNLTDDATYYSGLCSFQKGDMDQAKNQFEKTLLSANDTLHSSSYYYLGLISQQNKDFAQAKLALKNAEKASRNLASVHEEIEKKYELIDRQQAYENRVSRKFSGFVSLDFFQYNSNVVTLPDSLINISNAGGFGLAGTLGLNENVYRSDKFEANLNYQLNWNYHYNGALVPYDLWIHTLSVPTIQYIKWEHLQTRVTYQPGVSLLTFQSDGQRVIPPNQIPIKSYFFNTRHETALSEVELLTTQANFAYDQNDIASDPTNNGTGPRYYLSGVYTRYLSAKRDTSWYSGPGFEWVNTNGINYKQFRVSGVVGYQTSMFYDINAKPELGITYDDWYANENSRVDGQFKLGVTFSKNLTSSIFLSNYWSYLDNLSNVDVGKYTQFIFGLSIGVTF